MTWLSVSLLGPFFVALDDKPAAGFESDKVRALFSYLAVEADRPQRRDFLAGLFWPDGTDSAARANLRKALYNLRQVISDARAIVPYLIITPDTIQINPASDIWLDVRAFENFLAPRQDSIWTTFPIEDLTSGVSLYRGPFLEGFTLKDCPEFDEWAYLQRERLQGQALAALSELAEHHEQLLAYDKAIGFARRQLELAPWDEAVHCRLMRLLGQDGQRTAALAQYKECQRNLADELSVQPGKDTVKLYEQIRDGTIGTRVEEKPRPALPAPASRLVGREEELVEITARLQDPDCRLISLIGPGGSGKTRLAIETAACHGDHFRHGVYFIPLAQVQSEHAIMPNIAQAVGFTYRQEDLPEQEFLVSLRHKHMLLVLDNFEHLLPGVSRIQAILSEAPGVKILVTSRFRLDLQDEHLLALEGLGCPPQDPTLPDDGQNILGWPAVQLFLEGARRVRAAYTPPADDCARIAHICRMVDGIPLAILLAASWMVALSPEEIEGQIRTHSLEFLETSWRDVPERQRSLRAVFDHSWNLLSQREKESFAGLAVFRGGFNRAAAHYVAGLTLREISALVEKTLVHVAGEGRYDLHELLRQYATARLLETPAGGQAVEERHSQHYLGELRRLAADLVTPRQRETVREMAADLENSRKAWFWAIRNRPTAELGAALDGLCGFYDWFARYQEGEQACQASAALLKETSRSGVGAEPYAGSILLARVLAWHGQFCRLLGRTQAASQSLEEGLAILSAPPLQECETRTEMAQLLWQMGRLLFETSPGDSYRYIEQSLSLFRELSNQPMAAQALIMLGQILENESDYPRATRLVLEGLAILRESGDQLGAAAALRELSILTMQQGNLAGASELIQESYDICGELEDQAGIAESLFRQGCNQCFMGQFAESKATLEKAAAIFESLGYRSGIMTAYWCKAWDEENLGEFDNALPDVLAAQTIARELGHRRLIGGGLWSAGEYAGVKRDYVRAEQFLLDGAAIFREIRRWDELGLLLGHLADVEMHLGKAARARLHLAEALKIASRTGSWQAQVINLAYGASFMIMNHEPVRAIQLWALASRYPYIGNSVYWEEIAGKAVDQAASVLPPEAALAARQAGLASDLDVAVRNLLRSLQNRPAQTASKKVPV